MVGPDACERRLGLAELLIKVGGVDCGKHLTRLHRCADVVIPALHVAIHTREQRRAVERLYVAWQRQRLARAAWCRWRERDGRDALSVGPVHYLLFALRAAQKAIADHDAADENRSRGDGE